jgi:hypothetical protein
MLRTSQSEFKGGYNEEISDTVRADSGERSRVERRDVPQRVGAKDYCTLPSGATKSTSLRAAGYGALGGNSLDTPSELKEVPVAIQDESGQMLWSGKVPDEACLLVFENGGKVAVAQSGWGSTVNSDPLHGFRFINLTGQPLKLDLQGQGGLKGMRGVELGAAPDFAKVIQAPAGERTYKLVVQDGSGGIVNPDAGTVGTGSVLVLFNDNGKVVQYQAGVLRPKGR